MGFHNALDSASWIELLGHGECKREEEDGDRRWGAPVSDTRDPNIATSILHPTKKDESIVFWLIGLGLIGYIK